MLLNIGRIFELLIASIVGPLSAEKIQAILDRAPFFSTAALAPTKAILFDEKDEGGHGNKATQDVAPIIQSLQIEIKDWYDDCRIDQIELSPWLVYKVFNKVYSQLMSNNKFPSSIKEIGGALNMAAYAFYATWFAFGSFEKGELFGLSNVVATTNIQPENLKNYRNNDQFNVNVKPILEAFEKDNSIKAVTVALAKHPLKTWIDEVINLSLMKIEGGVDGKNKDIYLFNELIKNENNKKNSDIYKNLIVNFVESEKNSKGREEFLKFIYNVNKKEFLDKARKLTSAETPSPQADVQQKGKESDKGQE